MLSVSRYTSQIGCLRNAKGVTVATEVRQRSPVVWKGPVSAHSGVGARGLREGRETGSSQPRCHTERFGSPRLTNWGFREVYDAAQNVVVG
jgi:hypothetical protein